MSKRSLDVKKHADKPSPHTWYKASTKLFHLTTWQPTKSSSYDVQCKSSTVQPDAANFPTLHTAACFLEQVRHLQSSQVVQHFNRLRAVQPRWGASGYESVQAQLCIARCSKSYPPCTLQHAKALRAVAAYAKLATWCSSTVFFAVNIRAAKLRSIAAGMPCSHDAPSVLRAFLNTAACYARSLCRAGKVSTLCSSSLVVLLHKCSQAEEQQDDIKCNISTVRPDAV